MNQETKVNPELPPAREWRGGFDEDTVTWAFGRLAQTIVTEALTDEAERGAYRRWLSACSDRPSARPSEPLEGMLLKSTEFEDNGRVQVFARPVKDEFVLTASHPQFEVAVAFATADTLTNVDIVAMCVAHFEGKSCCSARWATDLRRWLLRQGRQTQEDAAAVRATTRHPAGTSWRGAWRQQLPAKC